MKYTKRFIEETFPVKEISEISAKEKMIRHGHISTLHIWWARRPLAASRATAFAALIPFPEDEETIKYFWAVLNPLFNKGILPKEKKTKNVIAAIKTFIIEMSRWENSTNQEIVDAARKMILHFNNGIPPKILDPFGGGGSIPLECLRLGCDTYSNDLNPVAVIIQKCTLEYPQKYGKPGYIEREVEDFGKKKKEKIWVENVLLEDVKYWGQWVLEEAKKELQQFYPLDKDGSIPVGYIWARTVPCQNPSCGIEIPLLRQFWLVKKTNKKVALYPYIKNKKIEFKIVGDGYEKWPPDFDPDEGTTSHAIVNCPLCKNSFDANKTRELFITGKSSEIMLCVVFNKINETGKFYRLSNRTDQNSFNKANESLIKAANEYISHFGITPIPDEELPLMSGVFNVPLYGINSWGKLFNARQMLVLIKFFNTLNKLESLLNQDNKDSEYTKAIFTYIAITVNNIAEKNTNVSRWGNSKETVAGIFSRQAIPMVWDYFEVIPIYDSTGGWSNAIEYNLKVINNTSFNNSATIKILNSSATKISLNENIFDSIFTDPPYYNSVPYADLSDFFYVLFKRSIQRIYPDLFITPLSPKKEEITEMQGWDPIRYNFKNKEFFENNLKNSFREIYRLLKTNGICIIVYAHKTTQGWETLINSLIDSGLIVTNAWPIDTEMSSRLRATDSAA